MVEQVLLDAHDLEPPEPFERATAALRGLQPGQYLKLLIPRRPRMLYPWLDEHGFEQHTLEAAPDAFEVYIWLHGDRACADAITGTRTD